MERNQRIDNCKAILIVLVVLGHLIESVGFKPLFSTSIYLAIYSFHMPAFAYLSGAVYKPKKIARIASTTLYPYLIFQILCRILVFIKNGGSFHLQLFTPFWVLWYLLALFFWHTGTEILEHKIQSKKGKGITLALLIILAISVGFVPQIGGFLALSRTIVYYPFYYAGSLFGVTCGTSKKKIVTGLSCACIWAGFLGFFCRNMTVAFFYNSVGYGLLGGYTWWIRVLQFILAGLMITAFVTLVSDKTDFLGFLLGRNSMQVYLLHMLVVQFLPIGVLLAEICDRAGTLQVLVLPVSAGVLAILFSLKPVAQVMRPLIRFPFENDV